jgi:peptidoglycan/LPS O-acetylase OafA/YrhL
MDSTVSGDPIATVPRVTAEPQVSSELSKPIHFPGLNGLRFIAALCVVFRHMEQLKIYYLGGMDQYAPDFFLYRIALTGDDAVTLFFVLSGFLITYLLLAEYQQSGTIRLKSFYARRTLRIWPLYYFMVFLAFIPYPWFEQAIGIYSPHTLLTNAGAGDVLLKLRDHVLFVPEISFHFGRFVAGISQLWTIGVEELFYLIWPVLAKSFMRRIQIVLIAIILLKGALIWWTLQPYYPSVPMSKDMRDFIAILLLIRVENMALGGLGACILFRNRHRILRVIYHPLAQVAALAGVVASIYYWEALPGTHRQFLIAVPFIVIILNVASNSRSLLKLENRILDRLGRISYGIYMYHVFVTGIVLTLVVKWFPVRPDGKDFVYNVLLYGLCTGLTLLVSHLSYEHFEKFFLRLKSRFSVVRSADQAEGVQVAG